MKFKNRKILNIILSIFIGLIMVYGTFMTDVSYGIEESMEDLFRQTLKESRKDEGLKIEKNLPDEEDIVTFIIEIDEYSGKELSRGRSLDIVAKDNGVMNRVLDSQEYYMEEIIKINSNAIFSNQYTLLINGFSVETKYGDRNKIEKIPGVKNISLSKVYNRDMKNSVKVTDIPYVWDNYGYDGAGKVVAVLDSGVDYNHKDMVISPGKKVKLTENRVKEIKGKQAEKRGKYFTAKVPFGYNYADKSDDILDRVVENIDYGHGMHVAGIIGANCQNENEINENKGVKGVAPESQILAMKIFSNNTRNQGASEADIISAIEDSVAYGADIINMSFCSTAGFQNPEDGQQKAIQAAIDEGIIVVAAAGNVAYSTYPDNHKELLDIGTVGAPGITNNSIQVASFENRTRTTYSLNTNVDGNKDKIAYVLSDFDPVFLKGEYEVVDCGIGKVEEFEGIQLKGKIALIKRGEIEFKDKKLNAQKKGAVGLIIYNNDGDESYLDNISTDERVKIPSIFIKNSDGIKISNMIKQGVKISFDGQKIEIPNINEGKMSYFTSWGPTPNLDLKPDLTAVGSNVWSTVNDDKYKTMSGTSMATPHTSGILALILQHLDAMNMDFESPAKKVKFSKTMLMNTAEVIIDKESGLPYSPRIQGAGLINAKKALENQTILTYKESPSVALGEISNNTDISLELFNSSDKDITYDIELLSKEGIKLEFNKENVTVRARETLELNGKLVLGNDIELDTFVEGFIKFVPQSEGTTCISIPFMGFYGDWGALKIVDEPACEKGSIFKQTSLFTIKNDGYIASTYPLGGKTMNPELFSINPEDVKANCNVLPQFSLLRNAKNLVIDVTDENEKVIKVIEDKEDLRKEIAMEQKINAKVNFGWIWKGTVYDKNIGEQKVIDEGQYFINIRTIADFQSAKEQITTFPLKIDKTPPMMKSGTFITNSNKCTIEIEAKDNGKVDSGIENFLFLLDGKKYTDEKGQFIFNLEPNEDGKYSMEIKLPEGAKKLTYTVDIGVTDYADNMTAGKAHIIYSPKSKIKISTNKRNYSLGEDIIVKYKMNEGIDESEFDHYEICIDSLDNPINNSKHMTYTIKEPLKSGTHKIFVKVIDNNGKTMDINFVEIEVGEGIDEKEKLIIENITDITSFTNGDNVSTKIRAINYYDQSKDITLIACLYDNNNRLVNSVAVEKTINSNKEVILTSNISIPDTGRYKIKIFAWDNFSNMKNLLPYTEIRQQD